MIKQLYIYIYIIFIVFPVAAWRITGRTGDKSASSGKVANNVGCQDKFIVKHLAHFICHF